MVNPGLKNPKVLVVGAGPAGLCGAIAVAETCKNGENVLIVDEGIEPGGQLPKQTHKFFWTRRFLRFNTWIRDRGKAREEGKESRSQVHA